MSLWSRLVDWCWDALSVPKCLLLINLSPRTNDRLGYCRITESILSQFCIPKYLKHLKLLVDEHTNSLYSPSFAIIFPQMRKFFSSVMPKRFYHVVLRTQSKSAQEKAAKIKKVSHEKPSIPLPIAFFLNINGIRKKCTAHLIYFASY